MQTLYDLTATLAKTSVTVRMTLELVGSPRYKIRINDTVYEHLVSNDKKQASLVVDCPLREPIKIVVTLYGKSYQEDSQSALIIHSLNLDGFEIVPGWTQLADYQNDRGANAPTNYLGFNGHWTLTIPEPFYIWRHRITGQGWLLNPKS